MLKNTKCLCGWVFGEHMGKTHQSKYHVADKGGRYYFCDCFRYNTLSFKIKPDIRYNRLSYRYVVTRKGTRLTLRQGLKVYKKVNVNVV